VGELVAAADCSLLRGEGLEELRRRGGVEGLRVEKDGEARR
jgi:hypothetical protein